ncbi:MAG: hypothetical protein IJ035_05085 [Oscillospiraceae bacterium]|nr:hypothetical protein [Oscillospiraceae bacterium]
MNFSKFHIKKIAAACTACAAVATMALPVSAVETIGSASIYLADETWSSQVYWGDSKDNIGIASVIPAEITGDGTYTTSVEFENAMDYGCFFSLNSDIKGTGSSSFADYPDAEITITSVKADGKEISGNASIADINDDGFMRVNIFDPLTDADGNYADSLEWTSGIKSMEVTFTVTGTGILSAEAPEEDDSSDDVSEGQTPENVPSDGNAENTDATTDSGDSPADEGSDDESQESVPADDNTEAPDTGNAPISPIAAVTALAGLVAFMTKKK